MINRKLVFYWDEDSNIFYPIGILPDEGYVPGDGYSHYEPKQGWGIVEIAAWLSDDIQCRIDSVNRWINNLTDLENSNAPDGDFGPGNAHWVLITGDYVFIGTEYVDEMQVLITKEQLLYVLEQYKAILEAGYDDPNNPPEPIDVEFIAEEQNAIDMYSNLEGAHEVWTEYS